MPQLDEFRLIKIEWLIIDKVFNKTLTRNLRGDKYTTLPLVIVSINSLIDKVEYTVKQMGENVYQSEVDEN